MTQLSKLVNRNLFSCHKNSLVRRAVADTPYAELAKHMVGRAYNISTDQ